MLTAELSLWGSDQTVVRAPLAASAYTAVAVSS